MGKKSYTSEEIKIGKYYNSGTNTIMKLLKRTNKKEESYPNAFSYIYIFEIIFLGRQGIIKVKKERALNPNYKCFTNLNKKELRNIINQKAKEINILKNILE